MPMNLDYVLVTYGIWIAAFVIYIPMMKFKLNRATQALESYQEKKKQ